MPVLSAVGIVPLTNNLAVVPRTVLAICIVERGVIDRLPLAVTTALPLPLGVSVTTL